MIRLIGRILLPIAAVLSPLAAQAQPPELRVEPYAFRLADGSDLAAERGTFSVPEDRRDARSRQIEIGFVRFRSTNPNPGAPIIYLAGGPGGSGVDTARGPRQPVFLALRAVADVILFDQRGTGLSNHIPPCQASGPMDSATVLSEASMTAYARQTLTACLERWRAAGVAVNGYTTEQSADDINDLRRALGAERVDLWAISYGTHLAMAAMRRHPGAIGRVAFASVEGMDQTVKLPAHIDAAFGRIGQALGMPLPDIMRRVHARMDAEPMTFNARRQDGSAVTFRSDSFAIRRLAGYLAKNPDTYGQMVGGYMALDAGQPGPVGQALWDFFYARPETMGGMSELMDVASGITDARLALIRRQVPASLLGMGVNFPMPQLDDAVPGLDLGDAFRREIAWPGPALIFEGDLDVRTPLEEQAAATAGFTNAQRVRFRNGGHDLFEAHTDVAPILTAFFSGRPVAVRELVLPVPELRRP